MVQQALVGHVHAVVVHHHRAVAQLALVLPRAGELGRVSNVDGNHDVGVEVRRGGLGAATAHLLAARTGKPQLGGVPGGGQAAHGLDHHVHAGAVVKGLAQQDVGVGLRGARRVKDAPVAHLDAQRVDLLGRLTAKVDVEVSGRAVGVALGKQGAAHLGTRAGGDAYELAVHTVLARVAHTDHVHHADVGDVAHHEAGFVHVPTDKHAHGVILGAGTLEHDAAQLVEGHLVGKRVELVMHHGTHLVLATGDRVSVAQTADQALVHRLLLGSWRGGRPQVHARLRGAPNFNLLAV